MKYKYIVPIVVGLFIIIIVGVIIVFGIKINCSFSVKHQNTIPIEVSEPITPGMTKREKIDTEVFWEIIDYSRRYNSKDIEEIAYTTKIELKPYSQQDIARFGIIADTYVKNIEKNKAIQSACLVINGTASDEDVHDFAQWIVSNGLTNYTMAAQHPDSISILNISVDEKYFYPELLDIAPKAYEERFGEGYEDVCRYIEEKEGKTIRQNILKDIKLYDDSKLTSKYPASIQQIPKILPMLCIMYDYNPTEVIKRMDAIKR